MGRNGWKSYAGLTHAVHNHTEICLIIRQIQAIWNISQLFQRQTALITKTEEETTAIASVCREDTNTD